jgi:hypothetical protein
MNLTSTIQAEQIQNFMKILVLGTRTFFFSCFFLQLNGPGAPALTTCVGIGFYEIRDARICLIILAWMDKAEYYKGHDMGGARWSPSSI